ncbi:Amino acid permease [Acidilobus saccharovorans 345-15]|uniref:Amino acid permease n=1 Tax=Acidilobus saccharovorans (strain DSM 16705 / JCM 18335 / VKM B-2471 / 345-15) TaxID=666510 RepID=D9Q0Z3_ACIS3|nr:Amino acid permease [Acidilobus saccharovorans 345-15]
MAANGPAATAALYFTTLAGLVGGSLPLVLLLAWLIYVGMTYIVYEWSKNITSTYLWAVMQKKGFGSSYLSFVIGGWGYWYYYITGAAGFAILGIAAFISLIFPSFYQTHPWIWIPIAIAVAAEVWAVVYTGAKVSTTYNLIAGLIEVAFLLLTGLILVLMFIHKNTFLPFTPIPLGKDWPIILTTMIFAITTFGGMNQAVPLGEEAIDPKRTVPKALAWLAFLIGVPIIFNAYAQEIVYGVDNMFKYSQLPDPGIIIYGSVLGSIAAIIFAVLVIYAFDASAVGFLNSAVRAGYGIARDGILFPSWFTKPNKFKVPGKNVTASAIIVTGTAIASGLVWGPVMGSVFLLTSNGYFNFINHLLASIGLVNFKRKRGERVGAGLIAVVIALVLALGAAIVLSAMAPPPLDYAGLTSLVWFIIGNIVYLVEKRRKPDNMKKFGEFTL